MGHKSREHRTTEIYAPFAPDYLDDASRAIDAYFEELRASYAPEIKPHFQVRNPQAIDIAIKTGAGDALQNIYYIQLKQHTKGIVVPICREDSREKCRQK